MENFIFDPQEVATFSDEKLRKVNLYESPRLFCDVYCLNPGQVQKIHTHAENDKIYVALSGACQVTVGETTTALEPGRLAIAPAGAPHGVRNNSDAPATLLVVMAPNPNF